MVLKYGIILLILPLIFAQNSVLNGINQFSNELVKNIERENPTANFVLSPISLHSTFSQVLVGAGGRTEAELESVLGVERSKRLVDQYAAIRRNNPALKTVDILALNRGFTPFQSFVKFLKDGFGSEVKEYDMVNNKKGAVREINRIVASHTNNKIQELLTSQDINGNTKMILVNAVYFKENWKTSFNPLDSFTADFQTPTFGKVMTKFMNIEMEAKHDQTKTLDILELPYEDSSTSMIFFLPKKGISSNNIMDSVARYPLKSLKSVQKSKALIAIPKFKMTFETNLKPNMAKMGMKELFTDSANFTKISNQKLKVSNGVHKAFIEVNEEGTEAAAATAVLFGTRSGGGRQKVFLANKPFMFMVYDSVDSIPLFIGKITNPSSPNERRTANLYQKSGKVQVTSQTQTTRKTQTTKSTFQSPKNNNNKCNTYQDTIGVAVHNSNECQRLKNNAKFLQKYKSVCSKSQDLFDNFIADNCGSSWCEYAAKNYVSWQQNYSAGCRSEKKSQECSNLSYDLKIGRTLCSL